MRKKKIFYFYEKKFFFLDKPEINLRNGQTIVSNLNLLVIENDRLTLDCQVQSNPSTIEPITWLKNGASMTGLFQSKNQIKSILFSFLRHQFTFTNITNN